ncbi:phosphomannomutase/phosphoglucomutase [Haloglycomyces albus]|uniref:phosphomannomutase/phosphoglucomutase n=1 Tax=Haloglycomyces albus TaxID=526067 RepID=UPI000684BB07|nr:phosphomannomutase/phosphoglucomutase [Haloglycomyces albus]
MTVHHSDAEELQKIVKAYDIRGLVDSQLTPRVLEALGCASAEVTGLSNWAVGHDMRASSPELAEAFARGVNRAGGDVAHAGLCATDMLYFISGSYDLAGAMLTASHNPASYNGLKMCLPGAKPISMTSGLADIRDRAMELLDGAEWPDQGGELLKREYLPEYANYLRDLVDLSGMRPLKVVVDAGNGMAGYTVPAVLGDEYLSPLPITVDPLYFELDGTFPNHEANPLDPANLVDLQKRVRSTDADLGLAFDGDADRCFVVDADGEPVSPSAITALVAQRQLREQPGATIVHNLITSRAVPEIIAENGGNAVRTRVGHSYIKATMAENDALFGGEHSAHYYFKGFWYADTGMLAALHVLAALGYGDRPLSDLAADFERYIASGEINSTVTDPNEKLEELQQIYGTKCDVDLDFLDGLTIAYKDGTWANIRPSNTEPLLRLNVEGPSLETMQRIRDEILTHIRA